MAFGAVLGNIWAAFYSTSGNTSPDTPNDIFKVKVVREQQLLWL